MHIPTFNITTRTIIYQKTKPNQNPAEEHREQTEPRTRVYFESLFGKEASKRVVYIPLAIIIGLGHQRKEKKERERTTRSRRARNSEARA